MANLWIRLTKQFGARWASQYGDCDDGTWASALRGVDSLTLGQALGRVALSGSEFPPSLPEFLGYCNQGAQVIPAPTKRIAHKKYDPNDPDIVEARERCMATMRSLTLGKPKPSRAWAPTPIRARRCIRSGVSFSCPDAVVTGARHAHRQRGRTCSLRDKSTDAPCGNSSRACEVLRQHW